MLMDKPLSSFYKSVLLASGLPCARGSLRQRQQPKCLGLLQGLGSAGHLQNSQHQAMNSNALLLYFPLLLLTL